MTRIGRCVAGGDEEPSEEFIIDLSKLSIQFCRLDVDFYEDGECPDATQCRLMPMREW